MRTSSIIDIITGTINEFLGKNKDLVDTRLSICRKCELYNDSHVLGEVCDKNKCINDICGCGCRIKAKATLLDEKCKLNKW